MLSSVLSKFRRSSRGFTHKSFAGKLLTGCALTVPAKIWLG